MKKFGEIDLGYSDAVNYQGNTRLKTMFNTVFVKDEKLDRLMRSDTYFLIGDKGTGKTAYATYLENQEYQNTSSKVIRINDTDYKIFIKMKQFGFLQLSDYKRVWKLILFTILAQTVDLKEIDLALFKRNALFTDLQNNIKSYYNSAFVPEISSVFKYIQERSDAANLGITIPLGQETSIGVKSKEKKSEEHNISKYQNNLVLLERDFSEAFTKLKTIKNRFLFIDNIDSRPDDIEISEYLLCLKGLAEAVWELNTNVFKSVKDSIGYCKIILLIRPDILSKLNLHNQANKVRDNSVFLDWRTSYANYRTSSLYKMCERLLSYNNDVNLADSWDTYFPWYTHSTSKERSFDDSFINCIRLSLSRPRDMISIMSAIQDNCKKSGRTTTILSDFADHECQNRISKYYIEEARDWCLYRFSSVEFETLMFFFTFLNGKSKFDYKYYMECYNKYTHQVSDRNMSLFEELLDANVFLQLLYELNMICYHEQTAKEQTLFRFCYRERELYNLSPQVKLNTTYSVHYALLKALNLGRNNEAESNEKI